jgi:hypothetical protein
MDEVRKELAAIRKENKLGRKNTKRLQKEMSLLNEKLDVLTKRGDGYKGMTCEYLSKDAILHTFQAFNAIAHRLRMIFNEESGTLQMLMEKKHLLHFLREEMSFPYNNLSEFQFLKHDRDGFAHPLTIPTEEELDNMITASNMSEEEGEEWKKVFVCLENLNMKVNSMPLGVQYLPNDLSDKQEIRMGRLKVAKQKETALANADSGAFALAKAPHRKKSAVRFSRETKGPKEAKEAGFK